MAGAEPKRRAADVAYDQIESMIATLQLQPGSAVVEADLVEKTGLGARRCAKRCCAWSRPG